MEGKKLNDKKISSFDFSLQSFNSFCDCTPFYFTEFPPLQKMKNKEFPELRSFRLDNNVFPGTNARTKMLQNCFFNSLVQMWKIATANRWEKKCIDVNRRLKSSAIYIMMMGLKIRFHFTVKSSNDSKAREPRLRIYRNYCHCREQWCIRGRSSDARIGEKSVLCNFRLENVSVTISICHLLHLPVSVNCTDWKCTL